MPRNISFFLTKRQFEDGSKDVTRRLGWWYCKPDEILMGVEKAQGLGKGGKINRLGLIRLASVRHEPLSAIITNREYGLIECRREGFPQMSPEEFVEFFCASHKKCTPESTINRLEFVRLPLPTQGDKE